jgi:hypothetical protein
LKSQIPWLRVFVEGVVIVGSILLAFGLQAWWEGRQERVEEREYMSALLTDLHADTVELAYNVRGWKYLESAARSTMDFISSSGSGTLNTDSLIVGAVLASMIRVPNLENATYEEMKSTGSLRLIRDKALRRLIVTFHQKLTWGDPFIERMSLRDGYLRYIPARVPAEFIRGGLNFCWGGATPMSDCGELLRDFDARSFVRDMQNDHEVGHLMNQRLADVIRVREIMEIRLGYGESLLEALEVAVSR